MSETPKPGPQRQRDESEPADRSRPQGEDPTLLQQDDDESAELEERAAAPQPPEPPKKRSDNPIVFDENETAR